MLGYFFTLLFIATAYITPEILFGPLGQYHVVIILAVLSVLASIPNLSKSGLLRVPQTYAVLGLCVAVVCSIAFSGWLGGVPLALYAFLPSVSAFFLAAVNCKRPWQIKLLFFVMVACSSFFIAHGASDLYHHIIPSPYVYGDITLARLRGLGFVNDPNDFSQVMVSLIPCVFMWKRRSAFANIFLLGLPIAVLVTGMYLTHSRGAALALMAVVAFSLRKKVGTVPAVLMAGLLLAGVLAVGWSGGRDVSMEAGADRLDAWTVGIGFIKSHPLFGIGFQRFSELNDITAHNSVIVCAAENGIPGFLCWVLLMFTTFRLSLEVGRPKDVSARVTKKKERSTRIPSVAEFWKARAEERRLAAASESANPVASRVALSAEAAEVQRLAQIMVLCMLGFLTAGWFLSRAMSMWLFLYCGIVVALGNMSEQEGLTVDRDPAKFNIKWVLAISAGLLIGVYIVLKVRAVTGG